MGGRWSWWLMGSKVCRRCDCLMEVLGIVDRYGYMAKFVMRNLTKAMFYFARRWYELCIYGIREMMYSVGILP